MTKTAITVISVLVIFLLFTSYLLINTLQDRYGGPQDLLPNNYTVGISDIASYSDSQLQFYPNMRFNHNDITYRINPSCTFEQADQFGSAADLLNDKVKGLIITQEPWTNEQADIEVLCGKEYLESDDLYVAGEGGPKFVMNQSLFTIILGGKVVLYRDSCSYNVELHELLHVFGFKHSNNKQSVMYNNSLCSQFLTGDIINEMARLYAYEPLPELYFEEMVVVKHGAYLDFNTTVENQGMINASEISMDLLVGDKVIQRFELGDVNFGGGRILRTKNIQLPNRDIKEVTFIIDPDNKTREYTKENNKITLEVK
ncbi:MAG: CARDB domain-containing protein [Nanoarchaeota archaeon]